MLLREQADSRSPLEIPFPTNWLESLSNLLKSMKKSEFGTVDALLAACAGDDPVAGLMLKRILYWHGSLQREFYLSTQDWWQQCRVQRRTVDRVKTRIFPTCGVLFELKFSKQAHANIPHYRLHEWKFMRRLSDVLGLPALYLLYRLCPDRTGRCVQNVQDVVSETSKTLTIESTIETSNDVVKNNVVPSKKIVDFKSTLPESTPEQLRVIEALKKANVPGQSAVSFALLPESIVQDCIASAQSAFEAKRVRNRVGYLIGALRKQLQAHKTQPPSESAFTETPPPNPLPIAAGPDEQDSDFADSHLDTSWRLPKPEHAEPAPVNERLLVSVSGSMTAQAAWSAAYHQLELQLDRASFDTWLRSAKLLDYENRVFTIRVHNTYARDMLQHRLYRNVARILRDVTGREMTVRFEAYKDGKIIPADETEPHDARLQRFLSRKTEN